MGGSVEEILAALTDHGAMTMSELAYHVGARKESIVFLVRSLEAGGLVTMAKMPDAQVMAAITQSGLDQLSAARAG